MAWFLNRALTNFRNAVNEAYPHRDKESDGTIGDPAHQATDSDHNPDGDGSVDAWDMDVEVNGPGKPYHDDIEALKRVFQGHESSLYWIHDGRIASRSWDWSWAPYSGANPHDKHVHWNTREAFEGSTLSWRITPVTVTDDVVVGLKTPDAWRDPTVKAAALAKNELLNGASLRGLVELILGAVRYGVGAAPVVVSAQVDEELLRRVIREEIDKTKLGT